MVDSEKAMSKTQGIRSHKDLIAWQKSMTLVADVYRTSRKLPQNEVFRLTSQMRRSAVSIPSNIAEGQGRATRGEFVQFLCHARGSLYELDTQITIAAALEYVTKEEPERLA